MDLAAEIRAEMGKQKLSLKDLADKPGLTVATVSRKVSTEERTLNVDELESISHALGVPSWEFMRRATKEKTAA